MKELLFNAPWWLPTTVILAGAILFWVGNSRREGRLRIAGLIVATVGILIIIASSVVETDTEKVVRKTKELVDSATKEDWPAVRALLDDKADLKIVPAMGVVPYTSADEIINSAKGKVTAIGLKSTAVSGIEPASAGDTITVSFDVRSEQNSTAGYPVPTSWQVDWQKFGSEWKATEIRCMKIANLSPQDMAREFPGMK